MKKLWSNLNPKYYPKVKAQKETFPFMKAPKSSISDTALRIADKRVV